MVSKDSRFKKHLNIYRGQVAGASVVLAFVHRNLNCWCFKPPTTHLFHRAAAGSISIIAGLDSVSVLLAFATKM